MTQEEFINNVKDVRPNVEVKLIDREWQLIETVYTYHPSINDKKHIALLYLDYGMAVITDMYYRACVIRDLEERIRSVRGDLVKLEDKYDAFDNPSSIAVPWEDN